MVRYPEGLWNLKTMLREGFIESTKRPETFEKFLDFCKKRNEYVWKGYRWIWLIIDEIIQRYISSFMLTLFNWISIHVYNYLFCFGGHVTQILSGLRIRIRRGLLARQKIRSSLQARARKTAPKERAFTYSSAILSINKRWILSFSAEKGQK